MTKYIEDQVKAGWKAYYIAVAKNDMITAKRIFDRTVALAEANLRRKTTQRILARV